MRTGTCAAAIALLAGLITLAAAQPPATQPDKDKLPAPGTTGNADNVPYIGKSDPQGNPVRLAKATGHVSNYSEDKVAAYTLPDPLVTSDKRPVTTADMWVKQRRPEILKFFRDEIYGAVPKNAPKVTWEVTETDANARKGTAVMRRVVGRMGDKKGGPRMTLTVFTPTKAREPVPLLLHLTFGSGLGGKPLGGYDFIEEALSRGWGYAALGYSDIQPDRPDRWTEGVIGLALKEGQTKPEADEWGTISAWAWGLSRAIDYFESDKSVNAKRISITGASRLGKTVLWAGAQDERVAAVFAAVPGEMGASLIRRDWGETLDDMAERFGYQFAGNLQKWVGKWNDLAVDQHMLIALSAPRPVFVSGGVKDQWSDPKGQFIAMVAAGPVYRLLGAKDLGTTELPPLDKPVTEGNLAYHYHSGGHTVLPADWKAFFDFADRQAKADVKGQPVVARPDAKTAVTVSDDDKQFTLSNGIVTARINKRNGDLESLVYKGLETMGHDQGRAGYWEQDPSAAAKVGGLTTAVTIDPKTNDGARAEVAVKGVTKGDRSAGLTPGSPGAPPGGTVNCDLEIRYALGRGDSGVYVYAIFSHPEQYGPLNMPESRFITKLNQTFDWISVDADRNMLACAPKDWGTGVVVHAKEQRILTRGVYKNSVEHKYSYNAVQYKVPAFGWSSTKEHVGIWFINPTIEYLGGGASKQELVCHFGDNGNPDPIILNYWRGTHYNGGATCYVPAGEKWSKVIGPIFIYVNSLESFRTPSPADLDTLAATAGNPTVPPAWKDNATALWQDALKQAKREAGQWPYEWVTDVDYPHKDERGTVTGRLVLNDPQAATKKLPHLTVGLAHPDGGGGRVNDWAHDAKHYQFWADGAEDGTFTIANVRPGTYTLHAFADGVLGEFARADVSVKVGKTLDLKGLEWKPVRYGKQVWEIGTPTRAGDKFFKGDGENYWLWGWGLRYPLLFPDDVTYTVGKSDYKKDWFFQQTPHATSTAWKNPEAKDPANQRFGWVKAESLDDYPQTNTTGPWRVYGRGRATTWTIKFDMGRAPKGEAALRVALAGADGNGGLAIAVNGQSAGTLRPVATNALRYNTNKSVWQELTLKFDAALLKKGQNEMHLTVPAGEVTTGVVYDYLRLELKEE